MRKAAAQRGLGRKRAPPRERRWGPLSRRPTMAEPLSTKGLMPGAQQTFLVDLRQAARAQHGHIAVDLLLQ